MDEPDGVRVDMRVSRVYVCLLADGRLDSSVANIVRIRHVMQCVLRDAILGVLIRYHIEFKSCGVDGVRLLILPVIPIL